MYIFVQQKRLKKTKIKKNPIAYFNYNTHNSIQVTRTRNNVSHNKEVDAGDNCMS